MYVTVKLTWIIFALVVGGLVFCAWRYPRTVIPISVGIAAAAALAAIMHL